MLFNQLEITAPLQLGSSPQSGGGASHKPTASTPLSGKLPLSRGGPDSHTSRAPLPAAADAQIRGQGEQPTGCWAWAGVAQICPHPQPDWCAVSGGHARPPLLRKQKRNRAETRLLSKPTGHPSERPRQGRLQQAELGCGPKNLARRALQGQANQGPT